jgi:hypothetical protein
MAWQNNKKSLNAFCSRFRSFPWMRLDSIPDSTDSYEECLVTFMHFLASAAATTRPSSEILILFCYRLASSHPLSGPVRSHLPSSTPHSLFSAEPSARSVADQRMQRREKAIEKLFKEQ